MSYDQKELRSALDGLYTRLNSREFVHPDPLEFLYRYPHIIDREIAALVASGLAYGRVSSILNGVQVVLEPLGPHPAVAVAGGGRAALRELYSGFRYRFTTGDELASLLDSVAIVQSEYGSLGEMFSSLLPEKTYRQTCDGFVRILLDRAGLASSTLLPLPSKGSACKRLNLFLRWMVRDDEVDPGGWEGVSPSELRIPLDVHMHRAGKLLGFTGRKTAGWKTVEEITSGFREICPEDPVKYDFALTRFGIRNEMDPEDIAEELGIGVSDPIAEG